MRHPNVVLFLGAGFANDGPFLVTELMAKGSLRKILDRSLELGDDGKPVEPLSWERRLSFAYDGAKALAYLHSQVGAHRDIKAEVRVVGSRPSAV